MAATGYTPIQLYYSTTAAAVPTAGNLSSGELAINITDGKLYYKSNAGVVTLLAGATAGPAGGSNTQVQFNSSGALAGSANMTFNGTTLVVNDLTDSSLTATRVVYAGTAGNLVDSANLTFNGTTLTPNALTVTNAVTLTGGTANGVLYLNGSKVATSGSALTFDGNIFGVNSTSNNLTANFNSDNASGLYIRFQNSGTSIGDVGSGLNLYTGGSASDFGINARTGSLIFSQGNTYRGRFDTSGNLLVNLATALANGKLQVAGSIGLSGNTEIRQATNSDGNTLRLLATQVVVGATNAMSYGYAGSALLASFASAASATVLEVGGNVAGHRLTVTNDSTGQSGNLNYTNTGGSRFYVNSLTGYAGFGTSSPVDQVSITTVDGGNTAAKLRLTGSNAGGIINFYNTTFPTGQFNFDQSGNFTLSQSLLYATSTIYPTLTIDTSQQLFMKANVTGFTDIKALRASAFGYSTTSYGALIIGATSGNITPCINVDPVANTGGAFSGTGGEVMFRNGVGFIQPNSANTNFNPILTFDTAGNGFYVTKSIGLGGTSPTSSGVGITFPATQSASSNANTLDDYEEGSWTPVLNFSGGTTGIVASYATGSYVKVGKVVHAWCSIYLSNKGSSTGDASVAGLPFVGSNGFYNEQTGSIADVNSITFGGIMMVRVGYSVIAGNISAIQLFQVTSGNAQTQVTNTGFINSSSFSCYVCYTTS